MARYMCVFTLNHIFLVYYIGFYQPSVLQVFLLSYYYIKLGFLLSIFLQLKV